MFSARFDKLNEDDQVLDEIELYIILNFFRNLTEHVFDNNNIRSQLDHQYQNHELKFSGWIFDEINSMTKYFFKTTEMNESIYVKIPLRPSPIINNENVFK